MSKVNLSVDLCNINLKNPIICASGTFGYGVEYDNILNLNQLGGISSKGLTLDGKYGNEGERLLETPSGLMNSIGLQNPGVRHFIEHELPQMKKLDTVILANLGGSTIETYEQGTILLNDTDIDMLELNISCPNVKAGGIAYGVKSESAREIVERIRKVCKKPLMVKLSPQAEDIIKMAKTCEEAGADAISLVNTFQGFAIDIKKRKPVFNNLYAGLSGPAIKPIALRMVHQVCKNVNIPVVGLGGIATGSDVIEFIMAGATAVQIGTANFIKPDITMDILEELKTFMENENIKDFNEIKGII